MKEDMESTPLEQWIAQAAYASEEALLTAGLKLETLQKVRQETRKREARWQLASVVMICLLVFFVSESRLHSLEHLTDSLLQPSSDRVSTLALCRLDLDGAGIGSWPHVEAVLSCKLRVQSALQAF